MKNGIILVVVILVTFFVGGKFWWDISENSRAARTETKQPIQKLSTLKQLQLEDKVATLRETGLLKRFDVQFNEAYVDPFLWGVVDVTTKEGIAITLAYYCGWKSGRDRDWVTIKDNQSGKKIAKYSETWGFKVY